MEELTSVIHLMETSGDGHLLGVSGSSSLGSVFSGTHQLSHARWYPVSFVVVCIPTDVFVAFAGNLRVVDERLGKLCC